jgi:hypothetical protein
MKANDARQLRPTRRRRRRERNRRPLDVARLTDLDRELAATRLDERTVLISAEEYTRLKRRDRRVISAGDLTERQIAALRGAKVPDQHADLDREIKDWKP